MCTGCPCRPAHSSTPSGPSMGRCLPLSPKACAFKLFGSLIWSLKGITMAGQPALRQEILSASNIFFSCLVCFVLFHFEAWSHSESTWPQLKGILLLQPPKCSDYCSSSDIINIVFFSYWHITHLSSVLSTVVLSRMSWALVVQLQWESLEELSVL